MHLAKNKDGKVSFGKMLILLLLGAAVINIILFIPEYLQNRKADKQYSALIEIQGSCTLRAIDLCRELTKKDCNQFPDYCLWKESGVCQKMECAYLNTMTQCAQLSSCEWRENRCQQIIDKDCYTTYTTRQQCEQDIENIGCIWEITGSGRRCVDTALFKPMQECISIKNKPECSKYNECLWTQSPASCFTIREVNSEEEQIITGLCAQQKTKSNCEEDKRCRWEVGSLARNSYVEESGY